MSAADDVFRVRARLSHGCEVVATATLICGPEPDVGIIGPWVDEAEIVSARTGARIPADLITDDDDERIFGALNEQLWARWCY